MSVQNLKFSGRRSLAEVISTLDKSGFARYTTVSKPNSAINWRQAPQGEIKVSPLSADTVIAL